MMSIKQFFLLLSGLSLCLLYSCNQQGANEKHGPIILGDTASIVTEKDPGNLKDIVKDLHPDFTRAEPKTDSVPPAKISTSSDTAKKATVAPASNPEPGLLAQFSELDFSIPGLQVKTGKKTDLNKAAGATFQLVEGNLSTKSIKIAKGNVQKLSQRYQTIIVLKNNLGTLPLETLNYLSDWEPLKGNNGTFAINGIGSKLEATDFNLASLQKAISKAARRHHLSRNLERQWQNSVRNTRANKKTINTVMRYICWKVDALDAHGKSYSKQIRVDLPMAL